MGPGPNLVGAELCIDRFESPAPDEAAGDVAIWDAHNGLVLRGFFARDYRWIVVPGVAVFRFGERGGTTAAPESTVSEATVRDVWLRSVLPLVVQSQGIEVLHASAVAGPGGIVALCGNAGAGKSTTAAAMRERGAAMLVADDALPFVVDEGGALALPLPFRLRLREPSVQMLGLPVHGAEDRGPPAELRGIVVLDPQDDAASPRLSALRSSEALAALLPHAYCFSLERGKERLFHAYARLCVAVPVRRLAYPQEIDRLSETVDTLLPLLV